MRINFITSDAISWLFLKLKSLLPLLLFGFIFVTCFIPDIIASEYNWGDYAEKYSRKIRVCHNDKADIKVELPSEFLEKYEKVTLVATYESTTFTITKKHQGNSFDLFQPRLKLNDRSFLGNYEVLVNESESSITYPLELKTKYLKPGENKFSFIYNWRNHKSECKSSCCGYNIYNLYFKEEPILKQFSVSILTNPSEALVYIDKKLSSNTPFNLKLTKGWYSITLEKEGYEKFEGQIYIVSDREIKYDLKKISK